MSDFDKEAEREKLREKYERDKAEREATQRMSDLLLKGATMTNTHCGTCGDPLFQQDGTTFCPSCHGNPDAVQGTDLEAQPAEESPGDGAAEAETDRADEPDGDSTAAADEDSTTGADADRPDSPAAADPSADDAPTRRFDSDASTAIDAGGGEPTPSSRPPETERDARPPASGSDPSRRDATARSEREAASTSRRSSVPSGASAGDLEAARDSLVAALEKFAAKAAETDDPRYAKECLEAAREASETLDALR